MKKYLLIFLFTFASAQTNIWKLVGSNILPYNSSYLTAIRLATATPAATGAIRYGSGTVQYYNGSAWISLSGASGGISAGNADSLGGQPASYYAVKADSTIVSAGYGITTPYVGHTVTVTADTSVLVNKAGIQIIDGQKTFTASTDFRNNISLTGRTVGGSNDSYPSVALYGRRNQGNFGIFFMFDSVRGANNYWAMAFQSDSSTSTTKNGFNIGRNGTPSLILDSNYHVGINGFAENTALYVKSRTRNLYLLNINDSLGVVKVLIDSTGAVTTGIWNGTDIARAYLDTTAYATTSATGFLKYSDFSTFNSKIGGSGSVNTIPMFTATSTLGNSGLSQTSGGDEIVTNDSLKVGASGTGVLRAGAGSFGALSGTTANLTDTLRVTSDITIGAGNAAGIIFDGTDYTARSGTNQIGESGGNSVYSSRGSHNFIMDNDANGVGTFGIFADGSTSNPMLQVFESGEASVKIKAWNLNGNALSIERYGSATDIFTMDTSGNISNVGTIASGAITSRAKVSADSSFAITERTTTPTFPTSNSQMLMYMKGDKIIWVINAAGTPRYYYFDATATANQSVIYSATEP